MSTRGAIARAAGDSFVGVYHHWDSYPQGLGASLWELYHGHFERDLERMLRVLIDEHPAGWSTIGGADWTQPAGWRERYSAPCAICGREMWQHYAQYYAQHDLPEPPHAPENYAVFDHHYQEADVPHGPECYCHGGRSEPAQVVDEGNAAGSGVEWVYVFDEGSRTMSVLASVNPSGSKMIGMFGAGNSRARWQVRASFSLDGPEPDWGRIAY